jgi:hypothetical protein
VKEDSALARIIGNKPVYNLGGYRAKKINSTSPGSGQGTHPQLTFLKENPVDQHKLWWRSSLPVLAALMLGLAPGASNVCAQEPLQFNVPYRCSDGTTYIIQRCETKGRGEYCFWREEKNGQLVTEAYSVRGQMYGRLNGCRVDAATQAAQPAGAPAINPPYLVEMPSVDRVKSALQGANPDDILARQVAVFTYLPQIVTRMQDPNRSVRTPNTPDEQRVIAAYNLAAYQMMQAYAKSHTPEQTNVFDKLHGRYEMDSKFFDQWFSALFSPEFRAAYDRVVSGKLANYQAHVDQERRDFEKDKAQQAAAAKGQSQFVRNDPGTLAARRCVELGGSELECIGKGFTTGLFDLAGVNPNLAEGAAQAGLRMTGIYKGESGFNVVFNDDSAGVNGCGKLIDAGHQYSVAKRGSQLLVEVQSEPQAFVLTLGPDGRLDGPGPIDVKGQIIVGYRKIWVERRRVSDNSVVPGSGHEEQEPIYAPKTERCTAAVLRPTAPTGTVGSLVATVGGVASGQSAEQAVQNSTKDLPAPGLRMIGRYAAQGGLSVEFHAGATVLDCGEAHVARTYAVENTPSQVLVTVKNGATPFTLTVRPDGTLTSPGSTEVAGRVVTGSTDNAIVFAPRNARCSIGTLAPGGALSQH